jgi:hypothetical protein
MKIAPLLLLAALAGPAAAKPVHVVLKPAVTVRPTADGFFTLGAVADITGGETAQRTRLAGILIGRAPLSGETRRLTRGDLALKLRQAGCNPEKAAVLEGADAAEVTATDAGPVGARFIASSAPVAQEGAMNRAPTPSSLKTQEPLIHRGAAVTIFIQTGPLTITAPGVARESGGAGQTIRVHREGVMTDLSVQVLDSQTVQLEI